MRLNVLRFVFALFFVVSSLSSTLPSVASSTHSPSRALVDAHSLLDETGQMTMKVGTQQEAYWSRRLHDGSATTNYIPAYHLWLGEARLAIDQQPEQAIVQFRQVRQSPVVSHKLKDLAEYDIAVAQFYAGAYGESSRSFWSMLTRKPRVTVDRRRISLWYRHASACAGYHLDHVRQGIPEPVKLDPYCAASALAICLRSLNLPYDRKSVASVCKVTGEGSTLNDVRSACKALKLNIHVFGADDKGLKGAPLPLIAYIEQDHFVAVTSVGNHGVTYICSDCGAWPGGEVTLNWKQWHTLEPSVYASVQKPNSRNDKLFAALESGVIPSFTKVAAAGLGHGIIPSSQEWISVAHALHPHVIFGNRLGNPKCGTKVASLHCTGSQSCPMVCLKKHDPVNVSSGEEEYAPPADLTVYNPNGPSVKWGRIYNSLRGTDPEYQSTDFGVGWSQSYNIGVFAPAVSQPEGDLVIYSTHLNGSTGALPAVGMEAPTAGVTWDIVRVGVPGTIADSIHPNSWLVQQTGSGATGKLNITFPPLVATGYYRARYTGTTQNYSLGFYVYQLPTVFSSPWINMGYDIGTNDDANASSPGSSPPNVNDFIVLPNGARIPFEVPPSSGAGLVHCTVAPGYPVDVQAYFQTSGALSGFVITFDDLTVWTTYFDTATFGTRTR